MLRVWATGWGLVRGNIWGEGGEERVQKEGDGLGYWVLCQVLLCVFGR